MADAIDPHLRPPDQMVMVPGDRPYLLIVPTDEGFVSVKGPLNNPAMCYGWLLQAYEYIVHRNVRVMGLHMEGGFLSDQGPGAGAAAGDGGPGGG